jgi:hypothetical protein
VTVTRQGNVLSPQERAALKRIVDLERRRLLLADALRHHDGPRLKHFVRIAAAKGLRRETAQVQRFR